MKKNLSFIILAAAFLLYGSIYTVTEIDQALVLQFGKPVHVEKEPGLHFKKPFFINNVEFFDKRILEISTQEVETTAADERRLIVDAFTKYRITDPLLFYQTYSSMRRFNLQFEKNVESILRDIVSTAPLNDLLTEKRAALMDQIEAQLNADAEAFGVEVVDVRIVRTDLPAENSNAIFNNMQTVYEKVAKETRAKGEEDKKRIIADADKQVTIILAEAEREANRLRGEGEGQATKIFADSFGQDTEFFRFYRSMQAYDGAFGEEKQPTDMVLSPDSEFMKFFNNLEGR